MESIPSLHHVVEKTLLVLHVELLSQVIKGFQRLFMDKLFIRDTNDGEIFPKMLSGLGHEVVEDLLLLFCFALARAYLSVLSMRECQGQLEIREATCAKDFANEKVNRRTIQVGAALIDLYSQSIKLFVDGSSLW